MASFNKRNIVFIQLITLSRALAALLFISIALTPQYTSLSICLFLYACLSDILDGYLARKLLCTSKTGGLLDLFSDKYLTIISLIFAIAKDVPILPCAIGILREIFLLSIRNISVNGKLLFPPQRLIGALTIAPIWIGTLILLSAQYLKISSIYFSYYYWIIGLICTLNLLYKFHINWGSFKESFEE